MIDSLYPIFRDRWSATGSVYIISDTHFDDADCKFMDPNWISAGDAVSRIKAKVHKPDTLICLGDVGDPKYFDEINCYKVLITGNHDAIGKMKPHFNEIYTGPLFIGDRLLLSHEPIYGMSGFCCNLHGHVHQGVFNEGSNRFNFASDVINYQPISLGDLIKKEKILSKVENYHVLTVEKAKAKSESIDDNNVEIILN